MKKTIILFLLCATMQVFSQDTLRVATWNTLKFPEVNAQNRIPAFRKVIQAINPDILVVQELTSSAGVDYFNNDILGIIEPEAFSSAPFVDGPDTDNMIFYKKDKISLLSNRPIDTGLRDINEYVLKYKPNSAAPKLWLYVAHLKAGSTERDEVYRERDAETIREELDQRASDANFMIMGDFNLYNAYEPAYEMLTGEHENNNGRCFDPVNKPGWWHNSASFSKYHTQSTRINSVDDGASGGLDDRFDFILVSSSLMDEDEWYCDPESYQAYGNDGRHFNSYNINDNTNFAVPDSIADALYLASDHLPVVTNLVYNNPSAINDYVATAPQSWDVLPAYPNPFNGATMLSYEIDGPGLVQASVYNTRGQLIETLISHQHQPGAYTFKWQPQGLASGVYFIRWQGKNFLKIQKILYIM